MSRSFKIDLLIGVIDVVVSEADDHVLEHGGVLEVHFEPNLAISALRQTVEVGINLLEHAATTAE